MLLTGAHPAAAQVIDPGTVIQTIQASLWNPPSTDTAGITYRPDTGDLISCDSEIDETVDGITFDAGVNIWTHTRTGIVTGTATTVPWSNEPTGIAWDPAGGRLWTSDDDQKRLYEIEFGPDGTWNTADDIHTTLRGYNTASCDDLEDVAYNNLNGHLYVSSGGSQEICEIAPGPNGVFDGAANFGDDVVTTFSLTPFGISDAEGIVYDPFWNTLVVADRGTRDLYELTPEGGYLRKIDVTFPIGTPRPSGITIAPGSTNPMLRNYWVTDRGTDNNTDPNANDGRIFEVVAIPLGGNGPPIVDAGQPLTATWPQNTVNLSGFVSDDGHPYPPSVVAALWSKLSGPGSVSFGSAPSPSTSATFSAPGSYVLQLEGDDSLAQTVDTVSVILGSTVTLSTTVIGPGTLSVNPPGGSYTYGQTVTLTATPGPDAGFVGWSGDLSGATSSQPLLMNGNKFVTATFGTLHDVTVSTSGPGSVTLSPPGGSYPAGTVVTVTATPGANAVFDGFSGSLSGTTSPQQLLVNGDKTINASFTQHYTLSVTTTGPGSVTLSPPGGSYAAGTLVTLSALPGVNAVFSAWGGALSANVNPETLSVSANTAVSASFTQLYTVTATAVGPGSVTLNPPAGPYPAGSLVTITAVPAADATFVGWSGDLTGSTNPASLLVDGNESVTASFAAPYDVGVDVTGPGTVTLDPPGGTYVAGTVVTVTATPGANAVFAGFGGALSGTTSPQPLTVDGDETLSASFTQLYTLSVTTSGPGSVTLSPPGGSYAAGTPVTLIAVPGVNAVLGSWGGALGGHANPETLTIGADTAVSASFTQLYTVATATVGPGSVTLNPPTGPHALGTSVTVTATPDPDAAFLGWSGDLSGSSNPATLIVGGNESVTGTFARLYDVSVNPAGPGAVALDPPGGTYVAGSVVSVTATPGTNAVFDGFTGDLTGTTSPQLLTVDGDKTVGASFTETAYTLTVTVLGGGTVTLDPPAGPYPPGSTVTLTAVPAAAHVFGGWSGDAVGNANPLLLVMNADKAVHALFNGTGPTSCGIGPELAAVVPLLAWLHRRRRRGR